MTMSRPEPSNPGYVAIGRIFPWTSLSVAGMPFESRAEGLGVGFLVVYDSKETCLKDHPEMTAADLIHISPRE